MISFLFLSPQIQDGDHYVKRPPLRKSLTCHNYHVVETFFRAMESRIYFHHQFFNKMCLSTQNPTWLPYWLALLAQVTRLSDVQLLFHMGI